MKTRLATLVLMAALALSQIATINAQVTNPPYLSQFPSVERVKAEIKGNDPMDTAARQMGAFWQLKKIIEQMSGFRVHRNQLTPDEGRVANEYYAAYYYASQPYQHIQNSPSHPDKPKWHKMHTEYTYSDAFREELFTRLLSPQVRDLWAQTEGNTKKTVAASRKSREQAEAKEGLLTTERRTTPATSAAVPAGADPSIAKAKAAKVDTKVLGIQLGDPLQLPECDPLGFGSIISVGENRATVPQTCLYKELNLLGDFNIEAILPYKVDRSALADVQIIHLSKDFCPAWVTGCKAYGTMHNGRLAAIAFFTPGRGVERAVTNELRAKYGLPTIVKNATVTPDIGNPFRVNNPEWSLPGLRVEYQVVREDENEGRVNISEGIVRIETESAYQRRAAKKKEAAKPKL